MTDVIWEAFIKRHAAKAVTGAGVVAMTYDPPLRTFASDPQSRAAAFLKAYRVGWFYKAEHKIAGDIGGLDWHVSTGDDDSNETQDSLPQPGLDIPFANLSPIDQFQRLMEKPNPFQTGRQLREKSQIRLDMAGWTFLYLEGGAGGGLPTAMYGISPARMWPSYDRQGRLLGWVMDKDRTQPVPFDADEIVTIAYGSEDDTPFGVGVVEAVQAQVPLTELMARHQADVLTTGGRLAGMLTPKERALTEDEFLDVQRAWRNVASDPHAARRLLIFPEPMEWTSGAAKPEEIGLPELATLNRDEILTAFPISGYMLGMPFPSGLSGAALRREERTNYWEGTIHPRVDLWEEAIKVGILARYEAATGQTFDFDFEEPALDDAETLSAKVDALRGLVSAGFDEQEAVKAVGLDHIKFNGIPTPPPPPPTPADNGPGGQMTPDMAPDTTMPMAQRQNGQNSQSMRSAKAAQLRDERNAVIEPAQSRAKDALGRFLTEQRSRLVDAIRATYPSDKSARIAWKANPSWWDEAAEDKALGETLDPIYVEVSRGGLQVVADRVNRIAVNRFVRNVIADVQAYGAERIKGINETTRTAVRDLVAEGVRRGYSIAQLVDGVPDEAFGGIESLTVFDDARAEMIARTETALSYNRSVLTGYSEFGIEQMQAYDGDYDPECAERDGQVFALEEALAIEDHPNGTLDWAPVMDKAAHGPAPIVQQFILSPDGAMKALTQPPVVNVEPPDLEPVLAELTALRDDIAHLPAPVVEAPIVNVEPPIIKTLGIQDVRIVESTLPPRKRTVKRDLVGRITEISEE